MDDRKLTGVGPTPVSGKTFVGSTPEQAMSILWDGFFSNPFYPNQATIDASSFVGGFPMDGTAGSTEQIQSALGFPYTYQPITGTGGLAVVDASFLTTTWSPVTT